MVSKVSSWTGFSPSISNFPFSIIPPTVLPYSFMYHLLYNLSHDVCSFYITVVTVPLKSFVLCKAVSVEAYCRPVGFQGLMPPDF